VDIQGRRVLVTGASRGIGESLARAFAAAGATVVLVARSEGPLKDLAAELGGFAVPADLANSEDVAGLVGRIESDGGPIDVLVNNAGIEQAGQFSAMSAADLEQLYRVNLLAPVLLTHQALPGMMARGRGHIVNVSSLAGVGVFPGLVGYSSTKAGLTHFTAGLRADLRGLPIGTTVAELGPVPTGMLDRVYDYEPAERSFRRLRRMQLLTDVDRQTVARDIVDAVTHNRRHVRHPKRALIFPLLTESPRRIVEWLVTGIPPRA
jgi:short-subunit dehydrogenase